MNREALIMRSMVDIWPDIAVGMMPNHCILGARVAVEVGRYFGVPITERSTDTLVANALAWKLIGEAVPVEEWPDEAWTIGVNHESPGNGYPGHVIAESEHFVIDLSAAQFARTKKGIKGEALLAPKLDGFDWSASLVISSADDGTVIVYKPMTDTTYKTAPDWRNRLNWGTEASALIRLMKAEGLR